MAQVIGIAKVSGETGAANEMFIFTDKENQRQLTHPHTQEELWRYFLIRKRREKKGIVDWRTYMLDKRRSFKNELELARLEHDMAKNEDVLNLPEESDFSYNPNAKPKSK